MLACVGYTVLVATNGRDGLKLLDSQHVDLVLTDHFSDPRGPAHSCELTGSELVTKIKTRKPGVRVVILSGAVEVPEDLKGADMFVSKLEPVEEILAKLSALLGQS